MGDKAGAEASRAGAGRAGAGVGANGTGAGAGGLVRWSMVQQGASVS